MKKYEEAELKVILLENSVISTSGCTGKNKVDCKEGGGGADNYDSSSDTHPTEYY